MTSQASLDPVDPALRAEVHTLHQHLTQWTDAEVLGVEKGTDAETLRAAYHRLVRRYHPDAVAGADAELKLMLPGVFMRVVDAYQTLRKTAKPGQVLSPNLGPARVALAPTDAGERSSPDPALVARSGAPAHSVRASSTGQAPKPSTDASLSAPVEKASEPHAPSALESPLSEKLHEPKSPPASSPRSESVADRHALVAEALASARRLGPLGDAEAVVATLHAVLARADEPERRQIRLELARAYVSDPRWRRYGLTLLRDITSQDPHNAEALTILSKVYYREGLLARARATLVRVLAADPSHDEASATLQLVDQALEHRKRQAQPVCAPTDDTPVRTWFRRILRTTSPTAGAGSGAGPRGWASAA